MNNGPVIQNEERKQTVIQNTVTGQEDCIPTSRQTAGVDERGGRHFADTTYVLRSKDGALITDPKTQVFTCTTCLDEPLSQAAVTRCLCGAITCRKRCTRQDRDGYWCKRCYRRRMIRRFLTWVFHLTPRPSSAS